MPIDYSRFDHIGSDEDDSEDEPDSEDELLNEPAAPAQIPPSFLSGTDVKAPKKAHLSQFPPGWRCKAGIYLHPDDSRTFPIPITRTPPQEFDCAKAVSDVREEVSEKYVPWGFFDPLRGTMEGIMARVSSSSHDTSYGHFATPVEQVTAFRVGRHTLE